MKSILENRPALAAEVDKVAEVAGYLWQKGWAERNGGNITVNITEHVDDVIRAMEPVSGRFPIGTTLPRLKGCYFFCKGTNKRMRDLARRPMENGSVIRILDDCASYEIIADKAVKPTSELASHLAMHNQMIASGNGYKAALHTHPIDLIAMTHNPAFLEKDVLTNLLWSMIPETRAFCPKGLGIVPYKMPSSVELAEATIAQLREQGYQGFYVAVGLQSGGKLNIPGGDADGVMAGIDFMRQVNLHEKKTLSGKVVVIGGGNIGADVARTAVRCGAESVDLYCLEAYDDMPMGEEDRSECERDGITVHAGWGQTEIVVEDGKCAGIRFRKCTRVKNDEGRFAPEFDDSVSEQAECATVLYCIGQKVDWRELLTGTAVEFNPNGTVKADPVTYQTAEKDIFVGGDAYTGQKFAIDAIAAGKEGAISLHRFVQHATLTVGRNRRQFIELDKESALIPVNYDTTPRQRIGYNEALRRTFSDERVAFTEEQIKKETARCLSCGASIVDPNKCIGCGVCTTKCAFDAIHLHRERPECSRMYACEDKMKAILPYMIKREFKIKRAARKSK